MSDSSPRTLTRKTDHEEVRKHKLKDGKSRWHHIKNKKEIYIHRKDYFANERSLTVQGLCFKASETVSWMLDVAVGARSSPRRKDLLHRPTAKKTNRKIKPLVGMEKFCLLRHFYLPSPSRKCSALGPPSSAWREHLVWGCGGLGEHVVSEGRSDAVAVGIHGVVPVHVHVHVHGVQGDVTRVHGAVARVQLI